MSKYFIYFHNWWPGFENRSDGNHIGFFEKLFAENSTFQARGSAMKTLWMQLYSNAPKGSEQRKAIMDSVGVPETVTTQDDFLTAGIGYVAKNIEEKSDLNFNFFYTQSTNNSLNSSLFSISYNKTF